MTEIERIVLEGLKKYGRTKRIIDILDESGIPHTPELRLELANKLESKGLIENVVYKLPISIEASISKAGLKALDGLGFFTAALLHLLEFFPLVEPVAIV